MSLGGRDALHDITVQNDRTTSKARQDLQIVTDDHRDAEVGSAAFGLDDVKSTGRGHRPSSRRTPWRGRRACESRLPCASPLRGWERSARGSGRPIARRLTFCCERPRGRIGTVADACQTAPPAVRTDLDVGGVSPVVAPGADRTATWPTTSRIHERAPVVLGRGHRLQMTWIHTEHVAAQVVDRHPGRDAPRAFT